MLEQSAASSVVQSEGTGNLLRNNWGGRRMFKNNKTDKFNTHLTYYVVSVLHKFSILLEVNPSKTLNFLSGFTENCIP